MAGIAPTVANNIANAELRATAYTGPATVYVSLHTADPGTTGASEVTGGSYARQSAAFSAASGASASNSGAVNFTGMPSATVTHIGFWDAASAGNFQQSGALSGSVAVAAGNTLQFAVGAVTYQVTGI